MKTTTIARSLTSVLFPLSLLAPACVSPDAGEAVGEAASALAPPSVTVVSWSSGTDIEAKVYCTFDPSRAINATKCTCPGLSGTGVIQYDNNQVPDKCTMCQHDDWPCALEPEDQAGDVVVDFFYGSNGHAVYMTLDLDSPQQTQSATIGCSGQHPEGVEFAVVRAADSGGHINGKGRFDLGADCGN